LLEAELCFFHLSSEKNIINDADVDLTNFYSNIKDKNATFLKFLNSISRDWETLLQYVEPYQNEFNSLIIELRNKREVSRDLSFQKKLLRKIVKPIENTGNALVVPIYDEFARYFAKSLSSKLNRIADLEIKHSMEFDQNMLKNHFETSIKAAYYTMLRDEKSVSLDEENARFFFIREFCYGSMFRFNQNGKFNIPYGGMDYNKKSFRQKVDRLREPAVIKLLSRTDIYNLDFNKFLSEISLSANDFIFFDPPYDSDFTDYAKQPFGKDDHERVAKTFVELASKSVMIINKSEFTLDLYRRMQDRNSDLQISDYEKTYSYNVRGRNNRKTTHLLITNFSQKKISHRR